MEKSVSLKGRNDNPSGKSTILFLCTGNWYRSRFAEALTKHMLGDSHHVFSRGLEVSRIPKELPPSFENNNLFSIFTGEKLLEKGIPPYSVLERRGPIQLTMEDLLSATHVIALDKTEHYPMMLNLFPDHANCITYWEVPDVQKMPHQKGYGLPSCPSDQALDLIENHVATFVRNITIP